MRPLYLIRQKSKRPRYAPDASHSGLWYDRFCATWEFGEGRRWALVDVHRRNWLEAFTDAPPGEPALIEEFVNRQAALVEARGGVRFVMRTAARFMPGHGMKHPVGNGLAWHPSLGVPYLPGSSVKGLARAWAVNWQQADASLVTRIFGAPEQPGTVIFLDAVPVEPVRLTLDVINAHRPGYYASKDTPGDWHVPRVTTYIAVDEGVDFQFALMARVPDANTAKEDVEQARAWLREALEWLGAGARTSLGYGRFEPVP